MRRGWYTCPTESAPAGELERWVVARIRGVGRDPSVLAESIRQVRAQTQKAIADLERERRSIERELARRRKALKQPHTAVSTGAGDARQRDALRRSEARLTKVRERQLALSRDLVDEREVAQALSAFDPVWESLAPREQARIVRLPPPDDNDALARWLWCAANVCERMGDFDEAMRHLSELKRLAGTEDLDLGVDFVVQAEGAEERIRRRTTD